MSPGHLIAVDVLLLYVLLGPLVLFTTFVLLDSLERKMDSKFRKLIDKKAPALWTEEDVNVHMNWT